MLNTQREKKRFIAGAVCPECKALDTIVMYPDKLKVRRWPANSTTAIPAAKCWRSECCALRWRYTKTVV